MKNTRDLLRIARTAASEAGRFLASAGSRGRVIKFESRRDVKIRADSESERLIIRALRNRTGFPILTEESGLMAPRRGVECFKWIVDPLDGTINFSRGMPLSCVSIGLWKDDEPVLGVVYEFNRNELFSGIAGLGAWLNGRRIKVSRTPRKDRAVLLTGFPSDTDFSRGAIGSFVEDIRSYKKVRLLGSAALSLAYVAAGRADVYFEKDIMIWDVAAGVPIVMGGGGRCRVHRSSENGRLKFIVYASNGRWK